MLNISSHANGDTVGCSFTVTGTAGSEAPLRLTASKVVGGAATLISKVDVTNNEGNWTANVVLCSASKGDSIVIKIAKVPPPPASSITVTLNEDCDDC